MRDQQGRIGTQLRSHDRRGWTRLEIVALAIVVATIGCLLLPRLSLARENARRTICRQHLQRIGRALYLYHERRDHFPMAARWTMDGIDRSTIHDPQAPWPQAWPNITASHPGQHLKATRGNWLVELLPDLGFDELHDEWHSDAAIESESNRLLRTHHLSLILCPSDHYATKDNPYRQRTREEKIIEFARGCYAINGGSQRDCQIPGQSADPCPNGFTFEWNATNNTYAWWGIGIAGINRSFRSRDITARGATFVVVEEIRAGIHEVDSRGAWALGQIGSSITWGHGINGDDGAPNCSHPKGDDIARCNELHRIVGAGRLIAERMGCCSYCEGNVQATARSLHRGGVTTLRSDESVVFVTDTIDRALWHRLHDRHADPPIRSTPSPEISSADGPF